ncbi:uncharacterized protein JCM6883_006307 [Sporobolomyces salmoneus]|uniref:uncharacterized protein n=1 Tax=Sporobolomyces salmoneus TaxID=183962 RepID=UPI0031791AA2
MYDREEAVETLRPSSSSSSSNRNPAGDQHRLFNHPYSNPTNRHDYNRSTSSLSSSGTVMGRTERLMDELEVINTFPASFATRPPTAPLPSPPPTASQFRNPSLNSSPVPSSTHPLKPVYPDSPTSSVYSLPFNPARDAHSQKISQAEKIADNFRSDSISLASTSPHPFDSILRPSTSTTSPSPPRLDSRASKPFSSYEKPGSVPESESKAQAALQEKQRGRRKLKWWGVFWIVVIAGIAMGIGIAAVKGDATKKAENGKEAGAGESKSEELGTPSSMRGVEMSREIGSGTNGNIYNRNDVGPVDLL